MREDGRERGGGEREGGREGEREGGREGGREEGKKGRSERGRCDAVRRWNHRGGREGVGRETEKGGPSCTLLHGCPRRVRGAGVRPCPSARQPVREARVRQWCGSGGRTTWCRRPRCDTVAPVLVALPIRRECRPWPQQQPPCSSVPMLVGVRVRRQRSAEDGRSNARPTGVETPGLCR